MELRKAVAELYRVFQPYRLGPEFTGCEHCVDPRETERLASARLQDLSLEDLRRYAFKAMTTWGDARHFRHFLPRLLELAIDAPVDFEFEVLFGKLAYAKWEEWPRIERDCVDKYMRAYWLAAIERPPAYEHDESVSTVLCALGNARSSVRPFLDDWLEALGDAAAQHLAQFIMVNYESVTIRDRLANSYWENHQGNAAEVIEWIKAPAVGTYLRAHQAQLAEWQRVSLSLLEAIQAAS